MTTSIDDTPKGELILYQTEDGRTRIECRFEGESIWLTQTLMAEQSPPLDSRLRLAEWLVHGPPVSQDQGRHHFTAWGRHSAAPTSIGTAPH